MCALLEGREVYFAKVKSHQVLSKLSGYEKKVATGNHMADYLCVKALSKALKPGESKVFSQNIKGM